MLLKGYKRFKYTSITGKDFMKSWQRFIDIVASELR